MSRGLLDRIYMALVHPREGLREVSRDKPLAWALAVHAISFAVLRTASLLEFPGKKTGLFGSTGFLDVILFTLAATAALLVFAAILHGIAKGLRGDGSYFGLVCAMAFAVLPMVFFAPLWVLDVAFGLPGFILLVVGGVVLVLWSFVVLEIIALRQNYGLSVRRAVVAYIMPAAILVSIYIIVSGVTFCVEGLT